MHIKYHIRKNIKFMKNFRLLRYLIYRFLIIVLYTTPVNGKMIDQLEIEHQLIEDFIHIVSL